MLAPTHRDLGASVAATEGCARATVLRARAGFVVLATACALLVMPGIVPAQSVAKDSRSEASPPDFSGVWQVRFERAPSGRALLDELPDGVVMIDDAGGGELGEGDFAGLELSATARAQVESYDFREELRRENTCVMPTVVYTMQSPFPMQIHQGRDLLVLHHEYFDLYRVIHLQPQEPPPSEAPHTKSGFSLGRFEGDTLVVETTHIASGTMMNNGFDHSENLRMTERFRMSDDGRTLWLTQVYEDPEVFSGLAARYMAWNRDPGGFLYPYDCDPSYGE